MPPGAMPMLPGAMLPGAMLPGDMPMLPGAMPPGDMPMLPGAMPPGDMLMLPGAVLPGAMPLRAELKLCWFSASVAALPGSCRMVELPLAECRIVGCGWRIGCRGVAALAAAANDAEAIRAANRVEAIFRLVMLCSFHRLCGARRHRIRNYRVAGRFQQSLLHLGNSNLSAVVRHTQFVTFRLFKRRCASPNALPAPLLRRRGEHRLTGR